MFYIVVIDAHRFVALGGLVYLVWMLIAASRALKVRGTEHISFTAAALRVMPTQAGLVRAISVVLLLSLGIAQGQARSWSPRTLLADCWGSLADLVR